MTDGVQRDEVSLHGLWGTVTDSTSLLARKQAREMVAYAEAVGEQLKDEEELLPDSGNKPPHRPPKPDSQVKVAERTGIPRQTISKAQTHVATADAFPFMKPWPQYRVLEAEEYIGKLPEAEHPTVIRLLSQPGIPPDSGLGIIINLAGKTTEQRATIYALNESKDSYQRGQALAMAADLPPMPDPRLVHLRAAIKSLHACVRLSKGGLKKSLESDIERLLILERSILDDDSNTAKG